MINEYLPIITLVISFGITHFIWKLLWRVLPFKVMDSIQTTPGVRFSLSVVMIFVIALFLQTLLGI